MNMRSQGRPWTGCRALKRLPKDLGLDLLELLSQIAILELQSRLSHSPPVLQPDLHIAQSDH